MNIKKVLSILITVVFIASAMSMSGCKKREEAPESTSSGSSSSSSKSSSSKTEKPLTENSVSTLLPGMVDVVKEYKQENPDTIGWFQIAQLNIGDVVVCKTEDVVVDGETIPANEYYRRRNFKQEKSFNGVLYADRRSVFGDGSAEQLGLNTAIYGHAMADIRGEKNYDVFFGPLHDFRDPEIAKTIPYIFLTTEKEDLAFEVFAVFMANTYNPDMHYNCNDLPEAEFLKVIDEQVLPRSLYKYNVEIKPGDKFLTLSTCIYNLPNGTTVAYPNTYIRYGIMAKLVDPSETLKKEADFTINEHPIIDADGQVF